MLRNTLAHLGGRVFSSMAGLIVTTAITIKLGPAAMGIFGIYMVLQNIAGVLDGGMAITLNRVMAVGTLADNPDKQHLRLFRTFECLNAIIGACFAVGLVLGLPWVVAQWGADHAQNFNLTAIAVFFGIALAIRFMHNLYHHALFGAHQHFAANRVIASFALLRCAAIVPALFVFHADLVWVFILYAANNALEILALMWACRTRGLWRLRVLPEWQLLRQHGRAMVPISAYTVVGIFLGQLDRMVVGHFVTLEEFGAYSLIASYAGGVMALAYAPGNVFFPTITQAVHRGNPAEAAQVVRAALRMILALTLPLSLWVVFYGPEIGTLFFSRPDIQTMTHGLWAPLFLNIAISILGIIPYKMLLAENRANDILKSNLLVLCLYPVLLVGGLWALGYPLGLYAVPLLSSFLTAQYLLRIVKINPSYRAMMGNMLRHSAVFAGVLGVMFAACHAFFLPTASPKVLAALHMGAPLALCGLAYFYWEIARPGWGKH